MLHSSNTTHKVLCCTIPNTFQGLLLVFLPWRGLFFYVHEWQWHFSRHFERISCSLPFCWAGYRRSTRFSAEEQGVFVYSSQPTPLPLTFSQCPRWSKTCLRLMLWEDGAVLASHRGLRCHKSRAGPIAEARGCRWRMGRRAQPAAVPASSTR